MTRPLFIIGNKRSGTSQLVRLLNLHPQVFVSHESDIIWVLYQFHHGLPFRAHPWDSDTGMRLTLKLCGHWLQREQSPRQNALAVQHALMEAGSPWLPPQRKTNLLWIGDKKPFQHTEPRLLAFLWENFPDVHFLHIIRHPCVVAASSDRFNRSRNGDFWLGLSAEEKVERWAFHERQVLSLRQTMPDRVHSLRYEDLCRRPAHELSRVFEFLQVPPARAALAEAARQTHAAVRPIPFIRCSAEATRIAASYGYGVQDPHRGSASGEGGG